MSEDPGNGRWSGLKTVAAILGSVAAIATAIAGIAAVFGGDDKGSETTLSGGTTSVGPTLAEWQDRANAICRSNLRKLRAIGQPTTQQEVILYLQRAVPISEASGNRLRALDEPADHAERIAEMLDLWDQSRESAQEAVSAAYAGNDAAFRSSWQTAVENDAAANRIAADLGAANCSEPAFE